MLEKKRYAQVGLGGRSEMYTEAIVLTYAETSELVGLCDNNAGRLQDRVEWAEAKGVQVAGYSDNEFERMIAETKPDCVIVTSKDCTHDEYICRAMELGCDVITEKPMTTDEKKCQRIIDTQKQTGRACRVTFNYRYAPPRKQVKELLMSGAIGEILSVDFHWLLDTSHGADYFRRWHRQMKNSGGLLVHKSTHHFDAVNWWLSTIPVSVFATGDTKFYKPQTAHRYGLKNRSIRCHGCPESHNCAFFLDIAANKNLNRLYFANEKYDGYFRDRCVFSSEIDIYDSVSAVLTYENGVKMSYSLNAFMPWEGYIVSFNGSKGRLEHKCEETVYINGDGSIPGALKKEGTWIRIYPHFQPAYEVEIWEAEGGHGGADPLMLEDIFNPGSQIDKYMLAADYRAGAYSILCGIAANHSIATGENILISDLVHGIKRPDFTPMPPANDPIPMILPPER
ncbi:Gfo/Idh/MocA family oxidoreductase [candidate division KSB1 bacterium]|nr:Gfo/Idh/MocA family oxidoreductase [candidate division KSB1 bacterium]